MARGSENKPESALFFGLPRVRKPWALEGGPLEGGPEATTGPFEKQGAHRAPS